MTAEEGRGPEPTVPLGQDRHGRPLASAAERLTPLVDRLRDRRLSGWGWPLLVTLLALGLRLWRLDRPRLLIFDETYYAKDAYSLLKFGYVRDFVENADTRIVDGHLTRLFRDYPSQIVHPDGGKWMIALGEQVFGMNTFGWRISAVVAGTLTVLVLARLVRRLTGSTFWGCVAGLVWCFDGLAFVMSRVALLDVFLAFWTTCAVACLVADRDHLRRRLAAYARDGTLPRGLGPALLWRPWRLGAGLCFGLALSCKWSALYVLAVFGVLAWLWDLSARRAIGVRVLWLRSALVDGVPAFGYLVVVAVLVYVASWTGWLIHHEAYEAQFGFGYGDAPAWGSYLDTPPSGLGDGTLTAFRSLWHYHQMMYDFHTGDYLAGQTHPYGSAPNGWLLMSRPVGMDAQLDLPSATAGCPADGGECLKQVLALGNPVVWWTGAAALVGCLWQWVWRHDWRFAVPVLGVAATWLPWFQFDDRPIFFFYAVTILPFTVIGLTLLAARLVGDRAASPRRHRWGTVAVGAWLVVVVLAFAYFYPIWSDQVISNDAWSDRMWFSRWI